mmetsp:Transcript_119165/g.342413  ORF Transcript_119165/g.342413 Transcript_119165/m.342413 type:complete len:117 (-) Transcript_119165:479-829(-)
MHHNSAGSKAPGVMYGMGSWPPPAGSTDGSEPMFQIGGGGVGSATALPHGEPPQDAMEAPGPHGPGANGPPPASTEGIVPTCCHINDGGSGPATPKGEAQHEPPDMGIVPEQGPGA